MADFKPLKIGSNNELSQFQTGDSVGLAAGGTGSTTAAGARTNLGLAIGTDIQGHSNKLDTLDALAGVGILVQDGSGGWFVRSVATASASRITLSNANGSGGNPTFDLATVTDSGTGTFKKIATDTWGRVTGTTAVVAADITALVDGTYINASGDTMLGFLTLNADPTNALHATTKQYVDNLFASGGVPPFPAVKARTTGNINLANPGTAVFDGITASNGDRILVPVQTVGSQNGIYIFNGSGVAMTRATDADTSGEFTPARQVFVQSGTVYNNTGWGVANATQPVIGTDTISFTQVSGANSYTNGNGISLTGNIFAAVGVAGQITVGGGGIGLASGVVTAGTYTKITVDTYGRATLGATATPADIGAQPADATLTALAAFNSNGFMVQTAADTFAARTLVQGSGITITNGDGIAGNPTIALTSGIVTPGTYNSVTVDTFGRVTGGTINNQDQLITSMTNGNASAVAIGRVVYVSGANTFDLANANNYSTAGAIGIVTSVSIAAAASGNVAVSGIATASTGQWDIVTGQSGGLTTGAKYYLSNTTAGAMTTTAPTTGILAPVGIALSTTKMKVNIQRVVIL